MSKHDPEELEKMIHRTLRSLPERRAPRSLEHRVLAAIEARQALPWWHKSFVHWPQAVKAVFLLLSGALAAVLVTLALRAGSDLGTPASVQNTLTTLGHLRAIGGSLADTCSAVVRNIPALWLYGGLAFLTFLYASLIGLGATAYRTLFHHR